jgi:hypothetical protein
VRRLAKVAEIERTGGAAVAGHGAVATPQGGQSS